MRDVLHTIGHSTHSIEQFVQLLREQRISAVADVRSRPYSRMNPQFSRDNLKVALKVACIAYVSLGNELGARSDDQSCYIDGKVQYERLAHTPLFRSGLTRLVDGIRSHRIALMCAEKDPITCHRMILVCHELRREPMDIMHIRADGTLESNADAEKRLIETNGLSELELFRSSDEIVEEAYQRQGKRIAWV